MKKFIFILIFLFAFSLDKQAQNIKTGSISGKILAADGSPVRGMQIELRNYSVKEVKNSFFWEGKARVDNTFAGPKGEYEFKGLPGNNYYLSIQFPQKMEKAYEYIQKPVIPIKLEQGQNIKDADYTLKQTRAIISGKVYEKNAVTPYANVTLELSCNDKIYASAGTNENGEYVFVFEPAEGQWKITVKDINKAVPAPLKIDLSKIDIFDNVNIICEK